MCSGQPLGLQLAPKSQILPVNQQERHSNKQTILFGEDKTRLPLYKTNLLMSPCKAAKSIELHRAVGSSAASRPIGRVMYGWVRTLLMQCFWILLCIVIVPQILKTLLFPVRTRYRTGTVLGATTPFGLDSTPQSHTPPWIVTRLSVDNWTRVCDWTHVYAMDHTTNLQTPLNTPLESICNNLSTTL